MPKRAKKSKMTLDKLAAMTQSEFLSVRKDMGEGFSGIREDLKNFATKDDLKNFATKGDLNDFKEEITDEFRKETAKVLQGVDKIITRFNKAEEDHAADKLLHDRHEKRLEKLEAKVL